MKYRCLRLLAGVAFGALFYGSSSALAQTSLGTAQNFAVLGGSTVTNTGSSTIVGEVGVSPGTAITGFPPGIVTGGTIHLNDGVAIQAQSDLTTAYNALAGQAFNVDLTGQDLGTVGTLTPGVYHFNSSAQLTGTLFLNALGNPNAVFIFQIGSTLTTASNSSVVVINGGSNCNVFWQVGSSATLGTGTTFAGNILALTSITLTTSARVSGRTLARNGAVTLDTNNVAVCAASCPGIITLSPATLPNGTVGVAYSQTITASGGTAPFTFTITSGSLPAGLTLSSGGVLSGTPTTAGTSNFTVRATDSAGCFGSQLYALIINAPVCPIITLSPSTLPGATPGVAYSQTITATGGAGPFTFSLVGGAPLSLTISPAGVLSGTPLTPGTFTIVVTATNAAGCTGFLSYAIVVSCPTITISPATLPNGQQFVPYSQQLTASGGTGPYVFTVTSGSLPSGMTLSAPGLLSGRPQSLGSFTFTVTATDPSGCTGTSAYTLILSALPNPIPTLSEWGLILLTGLLALAGFLTLRKSGRMRLG